MQSFHILHFALNAANVRCFNIYTMQIQKCNHSKGDLYYDKCYNQDLLFEPFVSHETQYKMRIVDAQNCVCVYFTSSVFACLCKYTRCYVNG